MRQGPGTLVPTIGLLGGLLAVLGANGCGRDSAPVQIVLVVCDTLRADHLTPYGYGRPTSPCLASFAAEATLYRHCQASAPWTLPSHASMLTGLEPREHGARTISAEELAALRAEGWEGNNNVAPLASEWITLAEHLAEKGWATGAIVANTAYLDPRYGIAQGFQDFVSQRGPVEEITRRSLEWVRRHKEESFFLLVNLMDTHRPYNTRPRANLPDRALEGNLLKRLLPLVMDPALEAPPELLQALSDQYDTAIANLDEGLGSFFSGLAQITSWSDLTVAVTSDHGEYLGEHDLLEHSKDVFQGALHVPLLVKGRGQKNAAEESRWLSLVHLPGILFGAAGLDLSSAPPQFFGHWPLGQARSENTDSRLHDLESAWGLGLRRRRSAFVEAGWKTILSSTGEVLTFDLAQDPLELAPLTSARAEEHQARARAAFEALRLAPPARPFELDDAAQAELDALGYGGG